MAQISIVVDQKTAGSVEQTKAVSEIDALDALHILEDMREDWICNEFHPPER